MARERMITRTIKETNVSVMCVDVTIGEVFTYDYVLTGEFQKNEDIMKALKKEHETADFKLVNIQSVETVEKLYGMAEADFIKLAKELPPRDTK